MKKDPGITGNFNVFMNGVLIHSTSDGHPPQTAQFQAIVEKIMNAQSMTS